MVARPTYPTSAEETAFFSICIPQFNRTSFLLESLRWLERQVFRNFEVCISDGLSTDGRAGELVHFLESSGMRHRYFLQPQRSPYDRNLRGAIALARGRYCFLLGNDDRLSSENTLQQVATALGTYNSPEVAVTNYTELSSGAAFRRTTKSGIIGAGVPAAAANFRNFSFVSGVILNRKLAQQYASDRWDGSEMYQTFLACRMIAAGGHLVGLNEVVIAKDIQLPGESVDSYARRPRAPKWPIRERELPLAQLGRVVFDAIEPFTRPKDRDAISKMIFQQLLLFTYPPWLVEYRRVQSLSFALGVAFGMRPKNLLKNVRLSLATKLYLRVLYMLVTVTGLTVPIWLFGRVRLRLYAFAKRR